MHRQWLLIAAGLTVAACQSENELRHTATLQSETAGLELSDDGSQSFAGMEGTTCTVDANWGCATADADLPSLEERVRDHWHDTTLGTSPEGVHQITGGVWSEDADLPLIDVRTAQLHAGGIVAVQGTTTTCFRHDAGVDVAIPGAVCADDTQMTVDRQTGDLYAGTSEGVYAVTTQGAVRVFDAAHAVSWDGGSETLYVVDSSQRTVRGLRHDGEVQWSADSATDIRSMHARGHRGELLVLVDDNDGFGVVERRDGTTGKVLGRSVVPSADAVLEVSDNGSRVALVRDDEVHFYALEADLSPDELETEEPECIEPSPTRRTRD